ncbi:MAG TPA: glycosyltransferase family 2 protein [Terracidiphilus sp.]|nr:glycosyltransferase family 2 protein [Terracidiphilus sp.]
MQTQILGTPTIPDEMLSQAPELSVIVPTFNESENVRRVVASLDACLKGISWEVIFVDDDSPDGTAARVREISRHDPRVRCLQRIGRRGLSSACTEGMLASSAPYVAVMDGDGQHDETVLRRMLEILREGTADIVVGSRYVDGGGIGEWNASRAKMSRFATHLSRLVIKQDLSDPMSGFFALRLDVLNPAVRKLSNIGFKILVDLMASSPQPLRLKEVPYEFRNRTAGESKLDSQAMWDYLMLLLDKLVGHIVPVRFLAFALVGTIGVLLHFAVLTVLFRALALPFTISQCGASIVAMVSNFGLNNALTFRDRRLKGWRWIKGLALFVLVCGIGAVANVGIASYLFSRNSMWVLAALAGIVVGAVWNYAMSAMYTWGRQKK